MVGFGEFAGLDWRFGWASIFGGLEICVDGGIGWVCLIIKLVGMEIWLGRRYMTVSDIWLDYTFGCVGDLDGFC